MTQCGFKGHDKPGLILHALDIVTPLSTEASIALARQPGLMSARKFPGSWSRESAWVSWRLPSLVLSGRLGLI
jgi:hypothetical protein